MYTTHHSFPSRQFGIVLFLALWMPAVSTAATSALPSDAPEWILPYTVQWLHVRDNIGGPGGDTCPPGEPGTTWFQQENVGYFPSFRLFTLAVPPGCPARGAEIFTDQALGYGRYIFIAMASGEPGVVNGLFSYGYQSESLLTEIDFEILGNDPEFLHTTVHWSEEDSTTRVHNLPDIIGTDAASGFHLYEFQWRPERVDFFVDGHHIETLPEALPQLPVALHTNTWTGNSEWGGGPPQQYGHMLLWLWPFFYVEQLPEPPTALCNDASLEPILGGNAALSLIKPQQGSEVPMRVRTYSNIEGVDFADGVIQGFVQADDGIWYPQAHQQLALCRNQYVSLMYTIGRAGSIDVGKNYNLASVLLTEPVPLDQPSPTLPPQALLVSPPVTVARGGDE